MKPAFDISSVRRTLRAGLTKPNPANPEIPMWTMEDLDTPSWGWKYNADTYAKAHPLSPQPTHKNLLREPDISEHVEVINPRDLADSRSVSGVSQERSHLLRSEETETSTEINNDSDQVREREEFNLPRELPI